jgi:hypothetical protein
VRCTDCRRSLLPPPPALAVLAFIAACAVLVGWQLYVGLGIGYAALWGVVALAWPAGFSFAKLWEDYDRTRKARERDERVFHPGPTGPVTLDVGDSADDRA